MMAEKTILVAGGAGFIGTHTVLQLLKEGFRVCIIDNLDTSSSLAVDRLREVAGSHLSEKLEFVLGYLRKKNDLEKLYALTKFDAVIHFAGLKAVAESVANPRRYFDNNLIGTINLYEIMEKYDSDVQDVKDLASAFDSTQRVNLRNLGFHKARNQALQPFKCYPAAQGSWCR